ncbi:MAG: hypothetical protein K8T20_00865 [Planctomycetes bacterium]|nr:hypothetical protein [Planctomycetota bacterium]
MIAAARGTSASADGIARYDARTSLAENATQRSVAAAFALCELLAKGVPDAENILAGLDAADEACDTALAQLSLGLYRTALVLPALKSK